MSLYKKIHVIGAVGSGKTTFAHKLSKLSGIITYELDDMVWQRKYPVDERFETSIRDEKLLETVSKEKWIIEGAQHKWVRPSFEAADLVVIIDTARLIRIWQILKRYFKQLLGREAAGYKPTWKLTKQLIVWSNNYQNYERERILKLLETIGVKYVILQNRKEQVLFLNEFKEES